MIGERIGGDELIKVQKEYFQVVVNCDLRNKSDSFQ